MKQPSGTLSLRHEQTAWRTVQRSPEPLKRVDEMLCRMLLTLACFAGIGLTNTQAQDVVHHVPRQTNVNGMAHGHNSNHLATPSRRGLPIVHYGYGYVHDPYARGTFEMQDPLKDPLFQAQHKFDSRFPGRYSPSEKRAYQQRVWKLFQR